MNKGSIIFFSTIAVVFVLTIFAIGKQFLWW